MTVPPPPPGVCSLTENKPLPLLMVKTRRKIDIGKKFRNCYRDIASIQQSKKQNLLTQQQIRVKHLAR